MDKTIYRFRTNKNNLIVARIIGAGLRAKVDLRTFKKNGNGKFLPAKEGIVFPLDLLPDLGKTVQYLTLYERYLE